MIAVAEVQADRGQGFPSQALDQEHSDVAGRGYFLLSAFADEQILRQIKMLGHLLLYRFYRQVRRLTGTSSLHDALSCLDGEFGFVDRAVGHQVD